MARLGIRASVQPAHLLDDRDLTERFWPDRTDRCFALRWLYDDGVRGRVRQRRPGLATGPVGRRWPPPSTAAPDDREPWHPEHTLTVHEALAASTNGLGTVALGHPADLALLESDPLPPRHVAASRPRRCGRCSVAATWVDGRPGSLLALRLGASGRPAAPRAMVSSRTLRGSSSRSPKTSRSWPMR